MSALKKIKKKLKDNVDKIAAISALVGGAGFVHYIIPTTFPHLYYTVTDPFITTATEQRIEEQFGIDYEGDSTEEKQKVLEEHLQEIYKTNPALLSHCGKIVLHSETVTNSSFVKPFLSFVGLTRPWGTTELIHSGLSIVAHELAHLVHHNAPKKFDDELDLIFGGLYGKGVKKVENEYRWEDGSWGPRNGFVEPYGATKASENVATYVAAAYNPYFWKNERLQQSDKYLKTLSLLEKYGFITLKQFEEIRVKIENKK